MTFIAAVKFYSFVASYSKMIVFKICFNCSQRQVSHSLSLHGATGLQVPADSLGVLCLEQASDRHSYKVTFVM